MAEEHEIAKIVSTFLGYEEHGIFTCQIRLDYGGSSQSAGGYALDTPTDDGRRGTAFGLEFVIRLMGACGVEEWDKVKGRTVFVIRKGPGLGARVLGIAPLPTEPGKEFYFDALSAEHFDNAAATR